MTTAEFPCFPSFDDFTTDHDVTLPSPPPPIPPPPPPPPPPSLFLLYEDEDTEIFPSSSLAFTDVDLFSSVPAPIPPPIPIPTPPDLNASLTKTLRKILRGHSSLSTASQQTRYMKDQVQFHGIKTPELKSIFSAFFTDHLSNLPEISQIRFAYLMLGSEFMEEKSVGVMILVKNLKYLDDSNLSEISTVIDQSVHEWATCDGIASKVLNSMIKRDDRFARSIASWRFSGSVWRLRCCCVAFVKVARFARHNETILEICTECVRHTERFVQLGVGWLLRELSVADEEAVIGFIKTNYASFSREGLRYAIEKMQAETRREILDYQKFVEAGMASELEMSAPVVSGGGPVRRSRSRGVMTAAGIPSRSSSPCLQKQHKAHRRGNNEEQPMILAPVPVVATAAAALAPATPPPPPCLSAPPPSTSTPVAPPTPPAPAPAHPQAPAGMTVQQYQQAFRSPTQFSRVSASRVAGLGLVPQSPSHLASLAANHARYQPYQQQLARQLNVQQQIAAQHQQQMQQKLSSSSSSLPSTCSTPMKPGAATLLSVLPANSSPSPVCPAPSRVQLLQQLQWVAQQQVTISNTVPVSPLTGGGIDCGVVGVPHTAGVSQLPHVPPPPPSQSPGLSLAMSKLTV